MSAVPPPRPQVDELPFVVPADDDEVESTFAPSEDVQSPAAMTFVVDVVSPLVNDDALGNSNERSSRPVAPFHVGRSSAYATATLLLSPPAPQTIDETHTFLRSSSWQQAERVPDDDVEPYVHIYDHEQRTFLFVRRQDVEVPLPSGAENDYAWSSMRQDDNRIHSNLVQMLPSRYDYHFYNTIPESWCRDFSPLGGANIYTTSTRRDRRRRETGAAARSGSDEDSDDVDGTAQTVTPPGSATTPTGGVVYRTASVMFRPSNNECAVRVCLPWYDNLDDIDEVLKFGRRHDEDERNGEQQSSSCWTRVDEGDTDGSASSRHTGTPMVDLGSILRRPKCLSCGWHEAGLRGGAKSGTATLLTRRDWPLASSIASRHRASCGGDHTSSQMALSIHGAAFDMFDYERTGTAAPFFGGGGWAGGLLDDTMLRLPYSPAASPASFTTTRQSVRVSCQPCPTDTGRGHSNAMALQDMSSLHPPCGGLSTSIIPCIDIWFVICFSFLPRTDFPSVRLVCRQLDVLLCSNCRFWVDRIPMVDSFFVADGGPTDSSCLVFAARRRTIAEHRNAGRWFTPLSTVPISARCMSGCCHNLWKHRSRMQHQVCAAAVLEETDVAEAVSVIRAILFPSTSSGSGLTNAVMALYPELIQNGGTATENALTARAFILNMRFARSDLLPTVTSNDPSQLFHSSHTMCVAAFTTGLVLLVSSLEIVLVVLVKSPGATSSGDGTTSSVTTTATSGTHSSVSSSSSPLMLLPLWILFVLVYPLCYRFFLGSAPRVVLMAMLQVAAVEGSVLLIYFQVTQQPLSPAPVGSSTSEGSLGGALQTSVVLRIVPVFISVTCIVIAHIAQVFQAWECRTGLSTKFPALWSSADNVPGPSVYAVVRWTVQTVLVFSIVGLVVLLMFEINDLVLLSQPTASSSVTLSPSSRGSPATMTPPWAPHILWFGLPLFSASISAAALIVQAVHRVGFRLLLVECSAILVVCAGYVVALGALAAVGLVMFYVGVEGASVGLLLSVTALFGVTSCVNSLASSCGRASSFAPR